MDRELTERDIISIRRGLVSDVINTICRLSRLAWPHTEEGNEDLSAQEQRAIDNAVTELLADLSLRRDRPFTCKVCCEPLPFFAREKKHVDGFCSAECRYDLRKERSKKKNQTRPLDF